MFIKPEVPNHRYAFPVPGLGAGPGGTDNKISLTDKPGYSTHNLQFTCLKCNKSCPWWKQSLFKYKWDFKHKRLGTNLLNGHVEKIAEKFDLENIFFVENCSKKWIVTLSSGCN